MMTHNERFQCTVPSGIRNIAGDNERAEADGGDDDCCYPVDRHAAVGELPTYLYPEP